MKHKGKLVIITWEYSGSYRMDCASGCNYKTGFAIILYRLYYLYIANDTQLLFWTLV